jgi:hypothetical protein
MTAARSWALVRSRVAAAVSRSVTGSAPAAANSSRGPRRVGHAGPSVSPLSSRAAFWSRLSASCGPGEVFGSEVEGVEIAGGCGAEQANRILLLTMDLYSHVMPSALRDAADAMDRTLSGGR